MFGNNSVISWPIPNTALSLRENWVDDADIVDKTPKDAEKKKKGLLKKIKNWFSSEPVPVYDNGGG